MSRVLDPTRCELGEGAYWHPERQSFLWFDILNRRLYERDARSGDQARCWTLPDQTSALGRLADGRFLLSSETGLWAFDPASGTRERIVAIAEDDPALRSNDGRADPWGGFWHSTMGKQAQPGAGAIWRWWRGELRCLYPGMTIPNAICFDRARSRAYHADTAEGIVWQQPLDPRTGWPAGERQVFLDLTSEGLNPDGAVTDAEGRFWNAQWGVGRVACYDPDGRFVQAVQVGARQASCPAFGGPDLSDLLVTTAWEGMDEADRAADPFAGATFIAPVATCGLPEPVVAI